jgi:hypothetical protein
LKLKQVFYIVLAALSVQVLVHFCVD